MDISNVRSSLFSTFRELMGAMKDTWSLSAKISVWNIEFTLSKCVSIDKSRQYDSKLTPYIKFMNTFLGFMQTMQMCFICVEIYRIIGRKKGSKYLNKTHLNKNSESARAYHMYATIVFNRVYHIFMYVFMYVLMSASLAT